MSSCYSHNTTPKSTYRFLKTSFYLNAVYIGFSNGNFRSGNGITLYHTDDNFPFFAAITSLNKKSQLDGHCIFYGQRILVSAEYERSRLNSLAYRIDGYLLFLKFNELSNIDGQCYLIDYTKHQISKIVYENGRVINKKNPYCPSSQKKQEFQQSIFNEGLVEKLIGIKHTKAISHQLKQFEGNLKKPILHYHIPNINMIKTANKIQVSYNVNADNSKPTLGFSFFYKSASRGGYNLDKDMYQDQFEMQLISKGQYYKGNMQGFGEKIFKNNNKYIGNFDQEVFNGLGILNNPVQKKWAFGSFQGGQMAQLLDSSEKDQQQKYQYYKLQIIKKCANNNIIPINIDQVDFSFADHQLAKIVQYGNNYQEDIQFSFQSRKKNILKKITQSFIDDNPNQTISSIKKPIDATKNSEVKSNTYYKINYMIPQQRMLQFEASMKKITKQRTHTQNDHNEQEIREVESFENIKQEQKRVSRIFNKTYDHLRKQQDDENSLLKLHTVSKGSKKKQKKFKIFQKSPNSFKSPEKIILQQNINSSSIYKRRFPERQTNIFGQRKSVSKSPKVTARSAYRLNPTTIKSTKSTFRQQPKTTRSTHRQQPYKTPQQTVRSTYRQYGKSTNRSPRKTYIFEQNSLENQKRNNFNYEIIEYEGGIQKEQDMKNKGSQILYNLTNKYGTKVFNTPKINNRFNATTKI